jgi:hypothetical protein
MDGFIAKGDLQAIEALELYGPGITKAQLVKVQDDAYKRYNSSTKASADRSAQETAFAATATTILGQVNSPTDRATMRKDMEYMMEFGAGTPANLSAMRARMIRLNAAIADPDAITPSTPSAVTRDFVADNFPASSIVTSEEDYDDMTEEEQNTISMYEMTLGTGVATMMKAHGLSNVVAAEAVHARMLAATLNAAGERKAVLPNALEMEEIVAELWTNYDTIDTPAAAPVESADKRPSHVSEEQWNKASDKVKALLRGQ